MNNKPLHVGPTRKTPKDDDCGCGGSKRVTNPRLRPQIKRKIRKKI